MVLAANPNLRLSLYSVRTSHYKHRETCRNQCCDNVMATTPKIICAICYEEAKPASEDLQSISLCGHVFHELCLQQWFEYHPPGCKSSCPLCKQPCLGQDAHRLFFQSASEATQLTQGKCPELPDSSNDVRVLQDTIQKLTCQLSMMKSALDANQIQLQELKEQLSFCTVRAEQAELARTQMQKETSSLNESISRIHAELKRCTVEKCNLNEKNSQLMKELASAKLVQNLDIDEDDVARMTHVGCKNKDDIIGTLTKSLIIRNRAYKDLMAKCNELGIGESKAAQKVEKAMERVKKLKARLQELEKQLEEKENSNLRFLKSSPLNSNSVDMFDSKHLNRKNNMDKGLFDSQPCLQPVHWIVDDEDVYISGDKTKDKQPQSERSDGSPAICSRDKTDSSEVCNILKNSEEQLVSQAPSNAVNSEDTLNRDRIPMTIRKETRLTAGTIGLNMVASKLDCFASKPSTWYKQSASARDTDMAVGSFICYGANGRGGQVKVLRPPPPMLKVGAISSDGLLRPMKRMKTSRSGTQGALQIEHFFSGAR